MDITERKGVPKDQEIQRKQIIPGVFLFNQEKFTVDSYQKIALTHAKHDEQRKAEGGRDKGST